MDIFKHKQEIIFKEIILAGWFLFKDNNYWIQFDKICKKAELKTKETLKIYF